MFQWEQCGLHANSRSGGAQIGSHQFKVSPNDLIYTEKLKYCDINDKVILPFERD